MLLATLNAGFAIGALTIAFQALRKGIPFLRYGWLLIQTGSAADVQQNVESRHSASEGGRFFFSGLLWLGGGLAALVGAVYFGVQAFQLINPI